MVDTREGEVAEADLPYAFDKQHPAKRIAIVAAGPLTNLILAVLLYGLSFSFGVTELRPYVGMVEPASIAAKAGFQAGDKIVSVNGIAVKDWSDAQTEMVLNLEAGPVKVAVQTASNAQAVRIIDAAGTPEAGKVAKNQGNIGLLPFRITNRIGKVLADSPAEKAGLKENDKLLTADGKPIESWQAWTELFRASPGKRIDARLTSVTVKYWRPLSGRTASSSQQACWWVEPGLLPRRIKSGIRPSATVIHLPLPKPLNWVGTKKPSTIRGRPSNFSENWLRAMPL